MPALWEEQENLKLTDAILWPLHSRDLTLMDERTNREEREKREGKREENPSCMSLPGSYLRLTPWN